MHRIKSSVKTEGFGNGLIWTVKTETSENTTLDASFLGDSGAVRKRSNMWTAPNGKIVGKIINSCLLNLACFLRLKCRASQSHMSS